MLMRTSVLAAEPSACAEGVSDASVLPELSVVIATHNRPDFLRSCLAALAPQVAGRPAEVIVVDSGSDADVSGQMRSLVQSYGFRFDRLEAPGVAKARNRGVALALGPWFATLDDDAVVNPGWLDGALEVARKAPVDAGLVQGRVEPWWLGAEPSKVEPRHARFLSIVTHDKDHEIKGAAHCAGANMLVRTRSHATTGGYGESFGRVGTNLVSGIDTDLVERLRKAGQRIFYSNAFSVRHAVPAIRMSLPWVRQRSLEDGRAQGRIVFGRGSFALRLGTVAKRLAALPVLGLMSLFKPQSVDLAIRRWVNLGCLEYAPGIGRLARAINERTAS